MKKISVLLTLIILACQQRAKAQELLIINAKIRSIQGSDRQGDAILCKEGKIVKIGASKKLLGAFKKNGTVIDLKGKQVVYPGIMDAHCHFTGYALDAYKCNLYSAASEADMMRTVKAYADTNKMPYIYGRGWDQNTWAVKEFPEKIQLDAWFPDRIVILKRIDGHGILANQYALDKAGITAETEIEGGQILKKNGKLTGLLIDNAMAKVEALIPDLPQEQSIGYLQTMEKECFRNGLTYIVDCGLPKRQIDLLDRLYDKEVLHIGMTALLSSDSATLGRYLQYGPFHTGALSVSGIKIYADGALGSRGACLLAPYTDDPHNFGTMLIPTVDVISLGYQAKQHNWQVFTHAIGDSANRAILKIYDMVLEPNNNYRWRIEHAQVVDPADYVYFKKKGIVPSVQPTHAISDMSWAGKRLGAARIHHAYSYKALLDQAGYIALGTDFPVEAINPLATFYTAIARKDSAGNPAGGFNPEGALSREEALKGMTIWAAKSIFKEAEKGSIEVDKDADFTILDTDLMTCQESKILKAEVMYTIVGGKIVYKKKD